MGLGAKELRIGNLIHREAYFVNERNLNNYIRKEYKEEDVYVTIDILKELETKGFFQPIPITEEWLLKFRFERGTNMGNGNIEYYKDDFYIWKNPNGKIDIELELQGYDIKKQIDILFVHQLQNLYFALTGEELTIKELTK